MNRVKVKRDICLKPSKITRIDSEYAACISIALFYLWQTGNLFVQKCFGGNMLLMLAMYLLLAAGIGISLLNAARTQVAYLLLSELIALILYGLSFLYGNAQTATLFYNLIWTLVICVPIALNIFSIRDLDRFWRLLYLLAKPMVIILCGMIFLEFHVLKTNLGGYDMPATYALIFYCIILCNAILEKAKIADIIVLLLGLGFDLLRGSRGTYFCFALFVIIKILFDINSSKKKRILLMCGIGAILIGVLAIVALRMYFANGVDSELLRFRSLTKLLSGELFRSDARAQLYRYYTELITQKPLLGWGVAGGWINSQNYPHNFFMEVMLAIGILPGVLVFFAMLVGMCYILRGNRTPERTLFLLYLANIFSLFISGTFLQNTSFFICVCLGIRCITCRRMQQRAYDNVKRKEYHAL